MINIICWLASFSARHRHCLLSKRQIYFLEPLPFAVSKENHRIGFRSRRIRARLHETRSELKPA